jgi:hypothetical protein
MRPMSLSGLERAYAPPKGHISMCPDKGKTIKSFPAQEGRIEDRTST